MNTKSKRGNILIGSLIVCLIAGGCLAMALAQNAVLNKQSADKQKVEQTSTEEVKMKWLISSPYRTWYSAEKPAIHNGVTSFKDQAGKDVRVTGNCYVMEL